VAQARHRVKISATVDPELLKGVDAYVQNHPGAGRSTIIDEALELWLARQQDRAMEDQFAAPDDIPEDELRQWNAVLDANARTMFGRDRE
jgi:hypothetical protein